MKKTQDDMQLRQLHTWGQYCPKQTDQEKKKKKIYKSSDYHALLSSVLDKTFWSKYTFIHTAAQLHQSSLASKI